MSVYVDYGVLIKLYIREPNSVAAAAIIQELPSVPLTSLHELEIRNTFRALVGGGAISAGQRTASEHMFDVDILAARLRRIVPDWPKVFLRAAELAAAYTEETLARSLDLLHVAAAGTSPDLFVTADRRQATVAERAGLPTQLIE